jgi:hypothetical protein
MRVRGIPSRWLGVERRVQSILAEWRQVERELEGAIDPDVREQLQGRISRFRDEYKHVVDDVEAHQMTPPADPLEREDSP